MIAKVGIKLALALPLAMSVGGTLPAFAQGPGGAVPVTVTTVQRSDVPVILRAIGTVQAFQSVLVRPRVDGTLDRVFFTEGQMVKPGDLLAQIDPRPYQAILDQALAKRASDEATLTSNRSDLVRYNELAQSQVASRQKVEQIRASVSQAEAATRGDDAQIAAAQLNLDFTRMTAPIAGRVGLRQLDPGNFVRAADVSTAGLVTIAQIQPIALIFTLPQDSLPKVQAAMQRSRLPVMAYSSDDRTLLSQGQLLTVDSLIDTTTGTIKLKAVFANIDDHLWPGQFVNVRMRLDTDRDVVTVPSIAVQRGQSGMYVFIVKTDDTVTAQTVEVSQDDGGVSVIKDGLRPGDRVVLAGHSRLTNGTKVTATEQKPAS